MIIYCRLCLKQNVEVQDIINSNLKCAELTLIESLYWIFGVEIDVNDTYSKFICVRCENVVHYIGSYRTLYRRNQLKLERKLNFQIDEDQFKQQVTEEENYYNNDFNNHKSDPSPEPKRKWEFIEYYYKFPTTALQELMKNKTSKIEHSKINGSMTDSLVHINGTVKVDVCKYCSKIFTRKKHLETHYKTRHKLLNFSDKRLKQRIKDKQNVNRFNMTRRQFRNRKTVMQNSINMNRLNIPKKKFLFDTRNFPNLNFMKQLEKCNKKAPVKYTYYQLKQSSSDEFDERPGSEDVGESEVRNHDNDSTSKELESSDEQMKTIRINENYLTVSEESTRKFINNKYKWLNLKDACVLVEKCRLPTEYQNCETVNNSHNKMKENQVKAITELNVVENGEKILEIPEQQDSLSSSLLKLRAMKEKLEASKQKYVKIKETSIECDDQHIQIYDKPLEVEEIIQNKEQDLKEKYKHLNLKACYVSVKKCAIPKGYYKRDNVANKKRIKRKIELLKKRPVAVENADLENMVQWKKRVAAALLRTQKLSSNPSTNLTDHGTASFGIENHPVLRNSHSGDNVDPHGQNNNHEEQLGHNKTINGTKWPYLKDFCIAVERCAVPKNFLDALESENLKKTATDTQLLKAKHVLDYRNPSNWILKNLTMTEHNYSIIKHPKDKCRKSPNDKEKKRKIQKRDVDFKNCLKKLEIVIPRIDPNLIKYNIVIPEHHQEMFNASSERLGILPEDMSHAHTLDDMPVLIKEVEVTIDSSKIILNKPPLLEPEVQMPSLPGTLHDIKKTEIQRSPSESMSCKIGKKGKKLQTSKEVKLPRESLNSTKIRDNVHLHNETVFSNKNILDKKPGILPLNEPMDIKSIIQSRWSQIRKDNANIIREALHAASSNIVEVALSPEQTDELNPQPIHI